MIVTNYNLNIYELFTNGGENSVTILEKHGLSLCYWNYLFRKKVYNIIEVIVLLLDFFWSLFTIVLLVWLWRWRAWSSIGSSSFSFCELWSRSVSFVITYILIFSWKFTFLAENTIRLSWTFHRRQFFRFLYFSKISVLEFVVSTFHM